MRVTDAAQLVQFPNRRWCALHTKARHEKRVASLCDGMHVPSYLPLYVHRTFSGGKVNTFRLPMFSGYVFAAVAPGEITELKRTKSVAQKIDAIDELALLRDLSHVLTIEMAQVELSTADALQPGQKAMISRGPLAGAPRELVHAVRQESRRRRAR